MSTDNAGEGLAVDWEVMASLTDEQHAAVGRLLASRVAASAEHENESGGWEPVQSSYAVGDFDIINSAGVEVAVRLTPADAERIVTMHNAEHPATPAEAAPKQCRRCGVTYRGANAGVLCEPPYASSHDFPPAEPDAGDADGLTEAERATLRDSWQMGPLVALDAVARIKREAEQRGAEKAAERIAQAIEAHPSPYLTRIHAARIARADATRSR